MGCNLNEFLLNISAFNYDILYKKSGKLSAIIKDITAYLYQFINLLIAFAFTSLQEKAWLFS